MVGCFGAFSTVPPLVQSLETSPMVAASTGAGPRTTSGALRQQRRPAADHRGRDCRTELDCAFVCTAVYQLLSVGQNGRQGHSGKPLPGERSDPFPPSAPCTGADGGAASSCGKDSSFSAAVTDNLTGPEMYDSRATPSGSTSLCVSATKLVLCALERV